PLATTQDGVNPAVYATYTIDGTASTVTPSSNAGTYGTSVTVRGGRTWTGAGANTDWSNAANWSGGNYPGLYDAAVVGPASTVSTVTAPFGFECEQFVMDSKMNRDFTINTSGGGGNF